MKKYFTLQLKRLARIFPLAITIAIVLFLSLAVILSGFVKMNENDRNNQTFKIGIAGDTDDRFFQLGKSALETFDSSRFSIAFIEMSEQEAGSQLDRGEISAYIVIPDGFIENAISGEVGKIKYVTSSGAVGLVSIFKNEITKVVEEILTCSQKGVFGLEDALVDNGYKKIAYKHINTINIEYIDLIISRGEMYTVEELGISGGLSFAEYLVCGITVLFLFIIGLPYVSLFVKKDLSLQRVISAKGYTCTKQVFSETVSYIIVLLLMLAVIFAVVTAGILLYPSLSKGEMLAIPDLFKFALPMIPTVLLAASFCVMIFELTSDVVSAVLLQFFASISLCYISGCLYPIYTFPTVVQKIAPFLPMGTARVYLQGCVEGEFSLTGFMGVISFSALFFVITLIIRKHKINKRS